MTDGPVWLDRDDVIQLHEEQIARYGGLPGVADIGRLDSTLARPKNLIAYGKPSLFELAACYAFGIAGNHRFNDGNKRTALVAAAVFLLDHGLLLPSSDQAAEMFERLAAGEVTESALAEWFHAIAVPIPISR